MAADRQGEKPGEGHSGSKAFPALFVWLLLSGCAPRPTELPNTIRAAPQPLKAVVEAPIRFEDVTDRAGLRFVATNARTPQKYLIETMGSGGAFLDYDRDGYLDILLLNGATLPGSKVTGHPTQKLYHNNHDGTFTDVTHKAHLDVTMYAMGCAVGDYDNDGYDDLYISGVLGPGHLYHNNRDGTFTEVTARAGVGNAGMWGTSCAWVDVDNDGYLDLFVCNYVRYRTLADDIPCNDRGKRSYCLPLHFPPSHCTLYHNNHDGTFTDISVASGIAAAPSKALGVAIWDYDHDGRPDIYVANDTTNGFLFHNLGHNRFEEVGVPSGVACDEQGIPHSGMGIDVNDLHNTGKSSVVITNYSGTETSLYEEESPGFYADRRSSDGVGPPSLHSLGFGAGFGDFDNDGFKDILVGNGHVQDDIEETQPNVRYAEEPLLYHNERNGPFREVGIASGAPFTKRIVARGVAWGDFDNDGRLDALITTNGGPASLWRNRTPTSNHWLLIRLIGTRSNRDGIGARITLRAGDQTQTTMVRSGSSYLSASDLRAHFGLGAATRASIEVQWPSGTVDRLPSIPADQIVTLVEGKGQAK